MVVCLKRIEAFIKLRKFLLRKKAFDLRLENCSTPRAKGRVLIFCRFTKLT